MMLLSGKCNLREKIDAHCLYDTGFVEGLSSETSGKVVIRGGIRVNDLLNLDYGQIAVITLPWTSVRLSCLP